MDHSSKIFALTEKLQHCFSKLFIDNSDGQFIILKDHLGGWSADYNNAIFDAIQKAAVSDGIGYKVKYHQVLESRVLEKYPHIQYFFCAEFQKKQNFEHFLTYRVHPDVEIKKFLSCFIGSDHVGRQLLSAILGNQNYFDPQYCSKNFAYENDWIVGHLNSLDLTEPEIALYSKFFFNEGDFNSTIYSFNYERFNHARNIYTLEKKLTSCFLHLNSETLPTSYYPFITEKFLYSIVTRGLFLSYAQPGWHKHLEKCYGFKLYDTVFDYSFDSILNPVKRLIRLIETIAKFSALSPNDWQDLYVIETDKIEYNHEHYFSGRYLETLRNNA